MYNINTSLLRVFRSKEPQSIKQRERAICFQTFNQGIDIALLCSTHGATGSYYGINPDYCRWIESRWSYINGRDINAFVILLFQAHEISSPRSVFLNEAGERHGLESHTGRGTERNLLHCASAAELKTRAFWRNPSVGAP